MTTKLIGVIIFLFSLCNLNGNAQTGSDIVKKMHDRYKQSWYRTLSFVQTTEILRADTLFRKETWYERASFPDDFRIDVGQKNSGNYTIYKPDSTYRFVNGQLKNVTAGGNPFTFLLGGMYAVPLEKVLEKFRTDGYDLTKSYSAKNLGKEVFIVGALPGDSTSNQFWVDRENLYVVRTIENMNGNRIDARMFNHKKLAGGWSEQRVEIYVNDKLRQIETYHDLEADIKIDPAVFRVR